MKRGSIASLPMRMRQKISHEDGCWPWIGRINNSGYSEVWYEGASCKAHRVIYALLIGPIPSGLQLDHLCRNRRCVNPEHLEPVTSRVNTLRGVSIPAQNARKTHCVRGHLLVADNLYTTQSRACRACFPVRRKANEERTRARPRGSGMEPAVLNSCS